MSLPKQSNFVSPESNFDEEKDVLTTNKDAQERSPDAVSGRDGTKIDKNDNPSIRDRADSCMRSCNEYMKNLEPCIERMKEFYDEIPILNPIGNVRIGWDLFVTVLLLYTCLEIPFTLAFEITLTLNDWAGDLAFIIDILLLFDICLNFRTAYFDDYDQMYLITSPKQIAKRYE